MRIDPLIDTAITEALAAEDYMAAGIFSMRFFESELVPTIGIDKHWNVYWSRRFMESVTPSETGALLRHEAWHPMKLHSERRPDNVHPYLWNVAADMDINSHVHGLPAGCVVPDPKPGMMAEEYLAEILKKQPPPPPQAQPQPGDGDGDGGGAGSPAQAGTAPPKPGKGKSKQPSPQAPPQAQPGPQAQPQPGDVYNPGNGQQSGSGSDGIQKIWETHGAHLSDKEKEEVIEAVKQAMRQSVSCGNEPSQSMRDWMGSAPQLKKIPWQGILASRMRQAANGKDRRTWLKPNEDMQASSVIFPGYAGSKTPVGMVIDVSGSISDEQLLIAISEVAKVARAANCAVELVTCDVEPISHGTKWNVASVKEIIGGGGTDMEAGIVFAARKDVELVICVTDCECHWSEHSPIRKPTIILNVGSGTPPAWAQHIKVE